MSRPLVPTIALLVCIAASAGYADPPLLSQKQAENLVGVWAQVDCLAKPALSAFHLRFNRGTLEGLVLGEEWASSSRQVKVTRWTRAGSAEPKIEILVWGSRAPEVKWTGRLHHGDLLLRLETSKAASENLRFRRVARDLKLAAGVAGTWSTWSVYPQFEPTAGAFAELNDRLTADAVAAHHGMEDDLKGIERPSEYEHLLPFSESIEVEVASFRPEAVSLATIWHAYTGGAHGQNDFETSTYTLRAGHPVQVDLRECLLPGSEPLAKLYKLARRAAAESPEELAGRFDQGSDQILGSFLLQSDGGIVLVIGGGPEVAPWAFVTLSSRNLGPLLDPKGPLGFLVRTE